MEYDFDLFVIGAGSGGVRTARMSASKGLKVGVAEYQALGGTCVNVGCIPKKLFVYASEYSHIFNQAKGFGWDITRTDFNWDVLRENKNKEIERLNKIYKNLLDHAGVKVIRGRASILDAHSVKVGNNVYTAKNILIATGGAPYIPEFPGNELVVTSNEVFYLKELPRKIIIVGGGYIAVEFAGIFKGLGVETHLVYRGPLFLKGFDGDIRNKIKEEYEIQGVNLHFSTDVEEVKKINSGYCVRLSTKEEIDVDLVMYATGRTPNIKDLGLESLKIKTKSNGTIIVDDYFNTSEPSIYALGDVIGRIELTPVAIAEGMALSNFFVTGIRSSVDYTNIPTAIFSQPNSASVGLTEEEAIKIHGIDLRIYKSQFRPMKATLGGGDSKVFMKLVVIDSSDIVVGCHMVGDYSGEIIQGLAVAIKAGATKQDFDSTVGIHPTAAEEFVTMRQPVG
ncbi:MAG: glutathione reductase (NADPH) [Porticoccus sp.]|jgi:glutathione reductase (NADPH)